MPSSRIKRTVQLKPNEQKRIMDRGEDRMAELGLSVAEVFGDNDGNPGRADIGRTAWYSYRAKPAAKGWRPVPMEALRELEQVLSFPAGELLKMAGWLPAGVEDFAREQGALLVAIEVNPELSREQKDSLITIYQGFLAKPRRHRRPQPST